MKKSSVGGCLMSDLYSIGSISCWGCSLLSLDLCSCSWSNRLSAFSLESLTRVDRPYREGSIVEDHST